MKVSTILAAGAAIVSLAAGAALPRQDSSLNAKKDIGASFPRVKLETMAKTSATFEAGPRAAAAAAEGEIKSLYSCAPTMLSPAYNAVFTFDPAAGKVKIENFGGFAANAEYGFVADMIEAPFADGVITIPCAGLAGEDNATKLGIFENLGMDIYLRVGKIEYDDNFMSSIPEAQPELKLYVSDDYSTIETRLEKGISVAGVIDYSDLFGFWACSAACSGGMNFSRMASGALWELSDSELDFGTIFTSKEVSRKFTIKSTGDEPIDFTVSSDSPAFIATPASGTVEASGKQTVNVTFNPSEAGEYNAALTVKVGDKEEHITMTGTAETIPTDFSAIVTEGDASKITWENGSGEPWRLVDGFAVCNSTKNGATSVLKATFSGNKPKRITYDIDMNIDIYDHLGMSIEGRRMYDYSGRLQHSVSYIIPGGNRSVEWVLSSGNYSDGFLKVGNLRIEEVASWEGLLPNATVSPLSAEGFYNINGNAAASTTDAVMMLSLSPKEDSNLSFDYEAGSSEITVTMNETDLAKIPAGEKGTFHYDMAKGTPAFIFVKVKTPADALTESAMIGNMRLTAGKYNDSPIVFNAIVNSYLDDEGSYSASAGTVHNYPVEITLTTGGKATFKHLLPEHSDYPLPQVIEGRIEGNKIHIPTWKNVNIGTLAGYDENSLDFYPVYYNNRYWLVAGKVNGEMKQTETLDELTLTISEDGRTITPDSDFGVWSTWSFENYGILSFFRADSKFIAQIEGAEITSSVENVDFGTVSANGYEYTRSFNILTLGDDCEYSAIVEGGDGHFSISPEAGNITAGESTTLTVEFTTEEAGDYNAVIRIYSDGNDLEIPVTAKADAVPDFSAIVTAGKELITFDSKTEYPWAMEDGAAVSTNTGIHNSMSTLTLNFSVPEGKIGLFSLKGATCAEPTYDGFAIRFNGETVHSEVAHNENMDVTLPVQAGEYRVELMHVRDTKDEIYSAYDRTILRELSLVIEDAGAHHFHVQPAYKMLAPVGEPVSDVVAVRNLSTTSIEITGVKGDGCFEPLMPEVTVLPSKFATVEIPVVFRADKAGEYEGVITVSTSAGEVKIPVAAEADYVKYIGSPSASSFAGPYVTALMQYGETEVTATMLYPAELMETLKGADIESVTFFPTSIPDYTFTCPDVTAEAGETDTFSIADRVKGLTPVMTGEMADAENWELTIPFDSPYTYNGGNFLFQLTNNVAEPYGGNTRIQMAFRHFPSLPGKTIITLHDTPEPAVETLPYMRVKYEPSTLGVETVMPPLSEIVEVRYYSIDGTRLTAPQKGLNVIVTVYKNGETSSTVMIKK